MSTLREITAEHISLQQLVEREEFTLDDVKDTFESLAGEFTAKAQSLVYVVNNISVDTTALDNEIKRLQARKTTLVNKEKSLREYLKTNMQMAGMTKISCPLFTITLAKGRDMVQIDDEAELLEDYREIVEVVKIDKAALLRDLKSGYLKSGCGASLVKSDESLRIK